MKVKISFTVEVDAEAWAKEYSLDISEVREDVKRYFESVEASPLEEYGAVKKV